MAREQRCHPFDVERQISAVEQFEHQGAHHAGSEEFRQMAVRERGSLTFEIKSAGKVFCSEVGVG